MDRVEIQADELKRCWSRISSIPEPRSPNDNFALVLLKGIDGAISLTAQNGYVYGVSRASASVDAGPDDTFNIQAVQMAKVIENAEGLVTFKRQGERMRVSCGRWQVFMPSVLGQFMRPEQHDSADKFVTRIEPLVFGLDAACMAIGKGHKQFAVELTVIDMSNSDNPVVFAMDGTNACVAPLPVVEKTEGGSSIKLPRKCVTTLLSFFRHEEGLVRIKYDMNWAGVYNNECALFVIQGEGLIPNWAKIFEINACTDPMQVNRQELSNAVKVASMASDTNSSDECCIHAAIGKGEIVLSAASSQFGSSEVSVPCETGEHDYQFRLHQHRFALALARFTDPMLTFGMSDNNCAVVFKSDALTWFCAVVTEGEA